jgi:hypothetical protein
VNAAARASTPSSMARVVAAAASLAARSFTLDVRSLAAFRIGLGLVVLADGILRGRDAALMFAPDGFFPPDVVRSFHGSPAAWSLALAGDTTWWGTTVVAAEAAAGTMLALGVCTRWSTVAAWALVMSVVQRTPPMTNAGDMWLISMLVWSIFLPLGEVWSIDARRRGGGPAASAARSIASAALVIQIATVYLGAGLAKCNVSWMSGEAMRHALSVHDHGNRLGMAIARLEWLSAPVTWLVVAVELVAPFVLVAVPSPRMRTALVAAFMVFHVAIQATMSVGLFAAIGITAWLAVVPAEAWTALRVAAPTGPLVGLSRWAGRCCAAALALAAVSFAHFWGLLGHPPLPTPVAAAITAVGVSQEWSMFGEVPRQEQWVYGRAVLADGTVVDLLRGGIPLDDHPPAGGFWSLPHHRWHKFFWVLPRPHVRVFGAPAAAALARQWNSRHPEDRQATSLELRFAVRTVGTSPTEQDMLLGSWPDRRHGAGNLDRLLRASGGEAVVDAWERNDGSNSAGDRAVLPERPAGRL